MNTDEYTWVFPYLVTRSLCKFEYVHIFTLVKNEHLCLCWNVVKEDMRRSWKGQPWGIPWSYRGRSRVYIRLLVRSQAAAAYKVELHFPSRRSTLIGMSDKLKENQMMSVHKIYIYFFYSKNISNVPSLSRAQGSNPSEAVVAVSSRERK